MGNTGYLLHRHFMDSTPAPRGEVFKHRFSKNGAFMKYRLGEEGFREIMELVGAKLVKAADKAQEAQ